MSYFKQKLNKLMSKDQDVGYGLQLQAPGSENPDAYIIAIHGLMGNSFKTWTHDDRTVWLKGSLPSKLPNVKILTFGYRLDTFSESQSKLTDAARDLLEQLKISRTAQNRRKPIIFVCHDLGGMVFKKSVTLAHEQNKLYGDVLGSTKHAVFLGAPHGSDHAMWSFLHNLAVVLGDRTGLEKNASEFTKINESFKPHSKTMGITSFYETQKTGKGPNSAIVADKESAKIGLPNEEPISLDEDHFTIAKIKAGGKSLVEGAVVNIVQRVIQSQSTLLEPTQESMTRGQQKILKSLYLIRASEMVQNISKPARNTCDWLMNDRAYVDWISDHRNRNRSLLWVEGPAGYGKSVLARYLKTHLERLETNATVCSFFCDSAIESRNHSTAVIRTILYQLVAKTPSLAKHALSMKGTQWLQDLPTLVDILKKCLQDPHLGNTYIIIDALNECKDALDLHHAQWLRAAMKEMPDSESKVRVMLTNRPNSAILADLRNGVDAFDWSFVIRLDRHASQMNGVKRFIHERVSELNESHRIPDEDKVWLTEELERESEGSFLWVSALLKNLNNSVGVSRGMMENMLKIKPANIQGLYSSMLGRVPLRDQNWTRSLLQAVVASYVPLTLSDLNWHSAVYQCPQEPERVEDFLLQNFERTLHNVLDGLVKVVDGVIYLEHITVREFLTANAAGPTSWCHFTYDEAYFEMARSCLLRLRSLAQTPGDCGPSENLVMYALRFAARHIQEVDRIEKPEFTKEVTSVYQDTSTFAKWLAGHRDANRMVSETNTKIVIKTIIQNTPLAPQDHETLHTTEYVEEELLEEKASTIRAASFFGHLRVFEALLNETDLNLEHEDGWTALCTAVERNQERMVEKVLGKGANIEKPALGRYPLHFAASLQQSTIVKVLLDNHAKVDSVSQDGETPLFSAARGGCDSTFDLLIEKKAKIEHRDSKGNTVLHVAISRGHTNIMRNVVQKIDSTIRNKAEKTPLDLAPEAKMEDIIGILLEKLEASTFMERHGDLIHSSKIRLTNPKILEMVVRVAVDAEKLDQTAYVGLPPTTSTSVVQSFIDKGVDIDQTDTSSCTLLHRAAREDCHELVEFLLNNGANKDKATQDGNTALHMAVSGRANQVLKILKRKEADLTLRNSQGYTPFHWAIAEWCSKETLIILHSLDMIETRNERGYTPLQTAVRLQNLGLVEFLTQPHIGADLFVLTSKGHNLLDLAQKSFLKNLAKLTIKGSLGTDYQSYAYGEGHAFDDHRYQHDRRGVAEVMLDKTQMIQDILKMKSSFTSQLEPTIKAFKVKPFKDEPVKEEKAVTPDETEEDET